MNILFLTDNFPPEVNAPASRTFEHCREWVKAGCQVTVITCVPNFPGGKIYNGYKNRLIQAETIDGINVIRVWTYITANEGFLKRILDYSSFMLSAVIASFTLNKPDVVVGTSPQFFTVCAAYIVSKIKHIPFVFELRDLWPESIKAVGAMKDSLIIRFLEYIEIFLYHQASVIISATHSFKRVLIKRGVFPEKIKVVMNGVDRTAFKPMTKDTDLVRQLGLEGKFVAGYIGTHGMAHALNTLIEAADRIRRLAGDDFRFIFLGDGARKQILKEKARQMKLSNVIFLDSVPKKEVPRYWSVLDTSVIHLKKTELFTTVIPSKLFECMGMGIPVIHGVAGESAEIVGNEGVGLIFEPENVNQLVVNLLKLKEDRNLYLQLKSNCLSAAKKYTRSEQAMKMLKYIEDFMESQPIIFMESQPIIRKD